MDWLNPIALIVAIVTSVVQTIIAVLTYRRDRHDE